MGFGLAPPNDLAAGNPGQLAPDGHDHPFVLAGTGEVVYIETDFVIPGVGFDFRWTRICRSALDHQRDFSKGWTHTAEVLLRESTDQLTVDAFLGNGRMEDSYTWNATTEEWDSPDGFYDDLVKYEPGGEQDPYYIKTDKNGVVWTFDHYLDLTKDLYCCTKIEDPWGNTIEFEYTDGSHPDYLTGITDTEGRDITVTHNGSGQITKVEVADSGFSDYGNLVIDYTYTGTDLTKVEKHYTRNADGGTKVRPYTEYTYISGGVADGDLDTVEDCGVEILDFDYTIYDSVSDRCTKVTNADGEEFTYTFDVSSTNHSVTEDVTRYIDPFGQKQEFVYEDMANDDRTVVERWDYLEDEDGADITDAAVTTFTRDCDCGRITDIEFTDGSKEEWTYDGLGNVTKYARVSSDSQDDDLVKAWTYDSFANYSRMLTSSGWLRKEASPSSKVTWTWNADGTLQKVTHPAVTTGQPSSQTIEWDYTWNVPVNDTDGRLGSVTNPAGEKIGYAYSGDTITKTQDPGGLERDFITVRNVFGVTTQTEDPTGTASQVDYTVTPYGRVLKVAGANSQETKYTYALRGFRTDSDQLLNTTGSVRVEGTTDYSSGGQVDETVADSDTGGIQATTTYTRDETNRWTKTIGPDDYGSKSLIGYGSHNLPWKAYHLYDTGTTIEETRTQTIERDTMGRVTATVDMGSSRTEFEYDGYGRHTKVITDLPSSKEQQMISTLEGDGQPEKVEVKVVGTGTTTYAITKYFYDQANRQYRVTREDPEAALTDRVTDVERDANGRVAVRIDALDKEWETQWDDAGRTKKTIDPVGNEIQYAYSDTNRTTTTTSHEYNTKTTSFTDYVSVATRDASGRTTSFKGEGSASGNRTTAYLYYESGQRKQKTAPESQKVVWEYDKLGRETKNTVDIVGGATQAITTTYWSAGGLKERVSDAKAINTRWTYNEFGQEEAVEYDDTATQTYTREYDTSGRLSTIEDPEGLVKTFVYDTADRVDYFDLTYPDPTDLVGPDRIDYTYDDMGRITTAKTQSESGGSHTDLITVTRAYNGFGEMDSETQHGSRTVTYDFDLNGALDEITYPSGGPVVGVQFVRDDNGRVLTVKRKLTTDVEGTSTSAWETTAEFKFAGGREYERKQTEYDLVRTQTYTSFREPDELTYKLISNSDLLTGLDSDWDDAGRMVTRERLHDIDGSTEMGEAYRYDDMGRLTTMWRDLESPHSFTTTDPTAGTANFQDKVAYTIGKVYERTQKQITPESGTPVETTVVGVDDLYQTTSVGSDTLTWDENGQLTDYGTGTDYVWTGLGQLATASVSGETDRDYTYDAFGRRVKTEVGSQVNEFLYHGWHMIAEYDDTTDDWLWQEIPLDRGERMLEHIALDTNDLDADSNTTEYRPYAVHEDFQSTAWGLSEADDGDLAERYDYTDPYGVSETKDGGGSSLGAYASNVFHRKRLHGGFVEKVTELYDFRNRWLDCEIGKWISRDKIGSFESMNLFQFCRSSPTLRVDSFGLLSSPGGGGAAWDPSNCKCPCMLNGTLAAQATKSKEACEKALKSGDLDSVQYYDCLERAKQVEGTKQKCEERTGNPTLKYCAYASGFGYPYEITWLYYKISRPLGDLKIISCWNCYDSGSDVCAETLIHELGHAFYSVLHPPGTNSLTDTQFAECVRLLTEALNNPTEATIAASEACWAKLQKDRP